MSRQAERKLSSAQVAPQEGNPSSAWAHRVQPVHSAASVHSTRAPSYDGLTLTLPKHSINEADNHYPRWQLPTDTRTSSLLSAASTKEGPSQSASSMLGLPPTLITLDRASQHSRVSQTQPNHIHLGLSSRSSPGHSGASSSTMSLPPVIDEYYARSAASSMQSQEIAAVEVPARKTSAVHGSISAGGVPLPSGTAAPSARASISITTQPGHGSSPVPSAKHSLAVNGTLTKTTAQGSNNVGPGASIAGFAAVNTPPFPGSGTYRAKLMSEPGKALANTLAGVDSPVQSTRSVSLSMAGADTLDKDFTFTLERASGRTTSSTTAAPMHADAKPAEPRTPDKRASILNTTSSPVTEPSSVIMDVATRARSTPGSASAASPRGSTFADVGVRDATATSRADTVSSVGQTSVVSQTGYDASDDESRRSAAWSNSTQGALPPAEQVFHRSKSIGPEDYDSTAPPRSRVRSEFWKQGLHAFDRLSKVEDKGHHRASAMTASATADGLGVTGSAWAGAHGRESTLDPLADLAALEQDLAAVMKRLPASLRYGARDGGSELVTTGLVQQLYSRVTRLQAMLRHKESEYQEVQRRALELQFKLTTSEAYQAGLDQQLQEASKKLEERDQELLELSKLARQAERHAIDVASGASRKNSVASGLTGPAGSAPHVAASEDVVALREALAAAQTALEQRDEQLSAANASLADRDRELREAEYVLRASEREMASQLNTAARRLLLTDKDSAVRAAHSASADSETSHEQDNIYKGYIRDLEVEVQNLRAALSVASPRNSSTKESPRASVHMSSAHTSQSSVSNVKAMLNQALTKAEVAEVQTNTATRGSSTAAGSLANPALSLEVADLRTELRRQQHAVEVMQMEASAALQTAERERESQQRLQVMVHSLHEDAARAVSEANRLTADLHKAKSQVASQHRVESQELAGRLEQARAELDAARLQLSRQQAMNSTEILELRHRVQQLENQLREAHSKLNNAEQMLQSASEDAKVWRTRHEATSERLSGEMDTSCRLKLQLSVYQGSISVLEKALAESREDLVEARQQQLADELSIHELRSKVDEMSSSTMNRLAEEWDVADRLARLHLDRLMELRHERYFLSSPAAWSNTQPPGTATMGPDPVADSAVVPGNIRQQTLDTLGALPGVLPLELADSVEWHSGLEVLERHLQLGSTSSAAVPSRASLRPAGYLMDDGTTSIQSSRLPSMAGTDVASVMDLSEVQASQPVSRRSTVEVAHVGATAVEHHTAAITKDGFLTAAVLTGGQPQDAASSAAAQRLTASLSGSVSFASETLDELMEGEHIGREGSQGCGKQSAPTRASTSTSVVQLVRRTLDGDASDA